MTKKVRVSKCCHANLLVAPRRHNKNKKYYTCSACGFWPASPVMAEEREDERERESGEKHKTI